MRIDEPDWTIISPVHDDAYLCSKFRMDPKTIRERLFAAHGPVALGKISLFDTWQCIFEDCPLADLCARSNRSYHIKVLGPYEDGACTALQHRKL